MVLALLLLTAGAACGSLKISGMGTGGTGGSLGPGSPCSMSAQCASGDCGAGNCCAAACTTSDAVCGALGCDDAGACVYPSAGTSCPGTSCSGSMLSQKACDGAGACQPQQVGTACPGNFVCAPDGGCLASCNSSADCASGFVCNAGTCVKPIEAGSCTENDDCTSEICGLAGTGNCCRALCTIGNATCGSTGCDDGGACLYPDHTVACGPGESCAANTQTNASLCDGLGHCSDGTIRCSPFVCGTNACKTTCALNTDCVAGDFCDVPAATCCADLVDGGTLAVDSALGDDAVACCGYDNAAPCRTLTRAMGLVKAGPTEEMVLQATVDGGASGDWTAEGEVYPIGLGWGVELSAPGVFFRGAIDAGSDVFQLGAIFELTADAGGDESASIVGTATNLVGIGMSQYGAKLLPYFSSAIAAGQGSTLYLANASVNGSWEYSIYAIDVSGTLILGQDRSGAVSGTVRIGNDSANNLIDGWIGIECDGCTLKDVPMNGTSSVVITGQGAYGIDVVGAIFDGGRAAIVSLSSAPIIGVAPSSVGFNTCPSKVGYFGISVSGLVTMSLDHATIQCIAEWGIVAGDGAYDSVEVPTLTINDTTIQNTEFALEVAAGSAVVSNSTIRYNGAGVVQENNFKGDLAGTIDLSGGAVGGRNTVACSNRIESGYADGGISVLNETSAALNASNVDWDTAGPDLFSCDSIQSGASFSNCTCQIAACTDAPGAAGMDAVVIDGGGTIVTNGNGLSPLDCTVPPGPDAGP